MRKWAQSGSVPWRETQLVVNGEDHRIDLRPKTVPKMDGGVSWVPFASKGQRSGNCHDDRLRKARLEENTRRYGIPQKQTHTVLIPGLRKVSRNLKLQKAY